MPRPSASRSSQVLPCDAELLTSLSSRQRLLLTTSLLLTIRSTFCQPRHQPAIRSHQDERQALIGIATVPRMRQPEADREPIGLATTIQSRPCSPTVSTTCQSSISSPS